MVIFRRLMIDSGKIERCLRAIFWSHFLTMERRPQLSWSLLIHTEIQTLINTIYRSQRYQQEPQPYPTTTSTPSTVDSTSLFISCSTKRTIGMLGAPLPTHAVLFL
jgi:hypothetical protein